MKVQDLMSQPVITISEETTLEAAARLMLDNNIGGLPVVGPDGELLGLITETSFSAKSRSVPFSTFSAPQVLGHWLTEEGMEKIYESARSTPVREIMKRRVISVEEGASVASAASLMLEHDISRLPVLRDGRPVGMIARRDLLKLLLDNGE